MGEGEGGMIWENGTETCIISYMKQQQQKELNLQRLALPSIGENVRCRDLPHTADGSINQQNHGVIIQ